ncbi:MAG: hypothetical protein Q7J16_01570 [Candidatus Cloacimonadales bacterium]|nr:hypothetical protein [Candidatus Cloacimonadales bacterium]
MGKIVVFILTGIFLFSCAQPGIKITGNIDEQITVNQSGNLAEILQKYNIQAEYILVVAADGTAFFVSDNSLTEIEISQKNGKFNSDTASLPPVCNLNNIIEICVYNSDFPLVDHQTPFSERISQFEFLGESSKDGHFVRKYKLNDERY